MLAYLIPDNIKADLVKFQYFFHSNFKKFVVFVRKKMK